MTPLLLVRDAASFATDLLATGVEKFIIQPFHFQRGKFVAGTRDEALGIVAAKLGCDRGQVMDHYGDHYDQAEHVIRRELQRAGCWLGKGKDGFRPPFRDAD